VLFRSKVSNRKIISFIKDVERRLLDIAPTAGTKSATYRIEEQLNQHYIKIFSEDQVETVKTESVNILLKISSQVSLNSKRSSLSNNAPNQLPLSKLFSNCVRILR